MLHGCACATLWLFACICVFLRVIYSQKERRTRFWHLRNCYRVSSRYSSPSTDTSKQRKLDARSKLPAFSKMSTNFTNDSLRSQGNCDSSADSSPLKIGKLFLLSIILIFSLVGNVLIITLVRVREELRSTINSFIVNMAASDLVITILLNSI